VHPCNMGLCCAAAAFQIRMCCCAGLRIVPLFNVSRFAVEEPAAGSFIFVWLPKSGFCEADRVRFCKSVSLCIIKTSYSINSIFHFNVLLRN
jgi:hypothetical protein